MTPLQAILSEYKLAKDQLSLTTVARVVTGLAAVNRDSNLILDIDNMVKLYNEGVDKPIQVGTYLTYPIRAKFERRTLTFFDTPVQRIEHYIAPDCTRPSILNAYGGVQEYFAMLTNWPRLSSKKEVLVFIDAEDTEEEQQSFEEVCDKIISIMKSHHDIVIKSAKQEAKTLAKATKQMNEINQNLTNKYANPNT